MASLSPAQWLAVAALSSGSSVTAAAKAAGVARETVSRWAHHNVAFIAELQNARAEIAAQTRCALEALGMRSVATLNEALQTGFMRLTRVRAACAVLKMLGADRAETLETTTPHEVQLRLRDREEKLRELQGKLDAKVDARPQPSEKPRLEACPQTAETLDNGSGPLSSAPVATGQDEPAQKAPPSVEQDELNQRLERGGLERHAEAVRECTEFARDLVDHIHNQCSGAGLPEGGKVSDYSLTGQLRALVNNGPRPAPPIPRDLHLRRSGRRRHAQANSKGCSQ